MPNRNGVRRKGAVRPGADFLARQAGLCRVGTWGPAAEFEQKRWHGAVQTKAIHESNGQRLFAIWAAIFQVESGEIRLLSRPATTRIGCGPTRYSGGAAIGPQLSEIHRTCSQGQPQQQPLTQSGRPLALGAHIAIRAPKAIPVPGGLSWCTHHQQG